MIEAREIHPVTFFAKDKNHKAVTKDFRPRTSVNEKEVEEEDNAEKEEPAAPVSDPPENDLPQPSQARLPAKD